MEGHFSASSLHPNGTDVPFQITHSKSFAFRRSGGPFIGTSTLTPTVSHSAVYLLACARVDVAGRDVQGVLEIRNSWINSGDIVYGFFQNRRN